MASSSFFEDCQGLIERGNDSWKSYFTKWEVFAKYEEDIPESYLVKKPNDSTKLAGKKKKKQITHIKKRKTLSSTSHKKNQRNQKQINKKKQTFLKSIAHTNLGQYTGSISDSENKITETEMLETNLKTFFRHFLRGNKNKLEIFGVLSLAISGSQEPNFKLFFSQQQALNCCDFQLNKEALSCMNQATLFSKIPKILVNSKLVSSVKNTYPEYFSRLLNSPEFHPHKIVEARKSNWINNHAFVDRHSRLEFNLKNKLNQSYIDPIPKLATQINLDGRNSCSFLLSPSHESSESKSLDWDLNHKTSVSICRKVNKEYFIKRTFPKMNIMQDGKRFRNLCLHKRTNSISLSMENSNFTTPERKPPERKGFSENVLQRKRRCPSKLFFDNEEDSESDDQTENQAPLICCQGKKLKTQITTEILKSDSDEYESIFDRVKKC